MRKVFFAGLLVLLMVFSYVGAVFADGMAYGYDHGLWRLMGERKQYCAINYSDGKQHMLLTVDFGDSIKKDKAVWIFPIPSKPENAKIGMAYGFPEIHGFDVKAAATKKLSDMFGAFRFSQVYPLIPPLFSPIVLGDPKGGNGNIIRDSISLMGITTQLINAAKPGDIIDYLGTKGFQLQSEYSSVLKSYSDSSYSFVVSWVSDFKEYRKYYKKMKEKFYDYNMLIGINISFPTDKLYFPLKPTSVYGSEIIPAEIYAIGYVKPELPKSIRKYASVNYYNKGGIFNNDKVHFLSNKISSSDINYTKIDIHAPSEKLSDDLWIKRTAPIKIKIYDAVDNANLFPFGLILFILCSCMTSLLIGRLCFKSQVLSNKSLIIIGLGNILSVIGTACFLAFTLRRKKDFKSLRKQAYEKASIYARVSLINVLTIIAFAFIFFFIGILFINFKSETAVLLIYLPASVTYFIIQILLKCRFKIKDEFRRDPSYKGLSLVNMPKLKFLIIFTIVSTVILSLVILVISENNEFLFDLQLDSPILLILMCIHLTFMLSLLAADFYAVSKIKHDNEILLRSKFPEITLFITLFALAFIGSTYIMQGLCQII